MSRDIPQHTNRFDEGYLPTARTEDLVSTEAAGKVLLYDTRLHHIHHLDAEVTTVWHHCDGTKTISMMSIATGIREERIRVALDDLARRELLVEDMPDHLRVSRMNRRKMAKLGIATLPGIISITAPIAKAAASGGATTPRLKGLNEPCAANSECHSDTCLMEAWEESGFCI